MARLFSLKPLVLALSVGFSTAATAQVADTSVPNAADYMPSENGQTVAQTAAEATQTTKTDSPKDKKDDLSLGETCLFCKHDAHQNHVANATSDTSAENIKRSGEQALPVDYTRVIANYVEGQTNVRVRAEGDVIIERNDEVLNSDWATYDQASNTVHAGDQYKLYQNGSVVTGTQLEYNLNDSTGVSENVHLASKQDGRRLQSVSEKAEMKGKGLYKLINTKFNTCEPGDASWYIRAKSIETDESTGIGVAKGAALVFGGVPILYTPWADFPIHGQRKSGFLVPNISSGSDGFKLSVPYYFNLRPNLDATLTPEIMTNRGVRIGGQLRYLQPQYSGIIDGTWMPTDKKSQYNNRSQLKWKHNQQITSHLSGGVEFNTVSDNDYYRDFYSRTDIAASTNLTQQAWLNYGNTLWGGDFNSSLKVQNYQTLANIYGYKDKPYAILPRLSADWSKNIGHAQINVQSQFTRFDHDTKQGVSRAFVYPSIKWDFHNQWGYIRPKIGVHATYYDLDKFGSQQRRTITRTLPIFNVDTGMEFDRQTKIFGHEFLQTLEPRLFYNYIPTKAQNDWPNFDTSENSFTYEQLFRENLFSGNDRINSANSISTAVQSRILNPKTGGELFRAGIGQKFYLKSDSINLDGTLNKSDRDRSDWVAFARGNIAKNVSADLNVHYDENNGNFASYSTGLRYNPEPGKVLSARYKYNRDTRIQLKDGVTYENLKQIDLAAQWPINKNLYAIARYNYEITVKKPLEMLAGVEYKSNCGCWSASLVAQRYVTSVNDTKNAIFFNLQLKDLSNIGNNPFEQLRLAIPGYSRTNEVNSK